MIAMLYRTSSAPSSVLYGKKLSTTYSYALIGCRRYLAMVAWHHEKNMVPKVHKYQINQKSGQVHSQMSLLSFLSNTESKIRTSGFAKSDKFAKHLGFFAFNQCHGLLHSRLVFRHWESALVNPVITQMTSFLTPRLLVSRSPLLSPLRQETSLLTSKLFLLRIPLPPWPLLRSPQSQLLTPKLPKTRTRPSHLLRCQTLRKQLRLVSLSGITSITQFWYRKK